MATHIRILTRKIPCTEKPVGLQSIGLQRFRHSQAIEHKHTASFHRGGHWASAQFSSVAQSCPTLCYPMDCSTQASLSITNSQSLLKLMSIESGMPSNYLILCCPLLLPPSSFTSIRVFSNESVLHFRWPKCWSFNFNISLFNEHSRLISCRMDQWDLLTVQGTAQ